MEVFEMKTLKEFSKSLNSQSEIMNERTKGVIDEIIGRVVTIIDYEFMNGDDGEFVAFVCKEIPEVFYFGSKVLTDGLKKCDENGYGEEIKRDGLPIKLIKKKSKKGREYTGVEYYPEA